MDTQFMNMNMYSSNKDLYSEKKTLQKYNVIENAGLQSELINKPYKLVLYKNVNTISVSQFWTLNEQIKDIVSVTLLTGIIYGVAGTSGFEFITLDIDELNKNHSDGTANFENSFAIFDYETLHATTAIFKNTYSVSNDIIYFDPPLNSLNQLTFRAYGDGLTFLTGDDQGGGMPPRPHPNIKYEN